MDGILSPDGESVLHESMWIEAILSPDESMYFHEGAGYSLDQEASSATSVRRATRLRRPEVTEVTVIHDEDNQGIALGGTAIIALGLLWLIFDSGKIISYAELAMMNCSTWSEFDSSYQTDIGGSCVTAKDEALTIVMVASAGVLVCLMGIFYSLASTPKSRVTKSRRYTDSNKIQKLKRCKYFFSDVQDLTQKIRCDNYHQNERFCDEHSLSYDHRCENLCGFAHLDIDVLEAHEKDCPKRNTLGANESKYSRP